MDAFAATRPVTPGAEADYRPGVCNIGPAEIRRRRWTGHVGLLATLVLLAVLVAVERRRSPGWWSGSRPWSPPPATSRRG